MHRLIGAACLAASVFLAGNRKALTVRSEVTRVRALRDAVSSLRTQVLFGRKRLIDCLSALSEEPLFSVLVRHLSEEPGRGLPEIVSDSLEECGDIPESAGRILLSLAPALEGADSDAQRQAFDLAGEELRSLLNGLESDAACRCREIRTVSLCIGLGIAILLI